MPAMGEDSLGSPHHANDDERLTGTSLLVTHVSADAASASAHYAFALSDLVFVLPGHSDPGHNSFGQATLQWAYNGGANALGKRVTAKQLVSRSGTGGSVLGAASAGAAVSTFLPSSSLPYIATALKDMALARLPATLHVMPETLAAQFPGAGSAVRVEADLDSIIAAAHAADCPAIVSHTVQEAADMALLASVLSARARIPVLHAVSACALGTSTSRTRLVRYSELSGISEQVSGVHFDDTAASLFTSGALDTRYGAVSYDGHAQPDAVFIVSGPGASVLSAVAARESCSGLGLKVGVVTVTLVHPWPAGAVKAAVPRSATRIVGLSFGSGPATSSTFQSLVATAVPSAGALRLSGAFTATHAQRLLHAAAIQYMPVSELADAAYLPLLVTQQSQKTQKGQFVPVSLNSLQVCILGLPQDGSDGLGHSTQRVLLDAGSKSVQGVFSEGLFERGAATLARISVDSTSTQVYSDECDVLLVTHHALLHAFDIPALVKQGGIVIMNAVPAAATGAVPSKEKDASDPAKESVVDPATVVTGELSMIDERALAAAGARVYAIDGAALCKAADLPIEALPLALQAALFAVRGAQSFATVASFLEREQRAMMPTAKSANIVRLHRAVRAGLQAVRLSANHGQDRKANQDGQNQARTRLLAPTPALVPVLRVRVPHATMPGVGPDEFKPAHTAVIPALSVGVQSSSQSVQVLSQNLSMQRAAIALTFPAAFGAQTTPMLENAEATVTASSAAAHAHASGGHGGDIHTVTVTRNVRLTPLEYDRNIFHIEMDITGTGLSYEIGSALGVYAVNDVAAVDAFLASYGLDAGGTVGLPVRGGEDTGAEEGKDDCIMVQTARRVFTHELDLFGKPSKEFYEKLASHARDAAQAQHLRLLGSAACAGIAGYAARDKEAYTHADVLNEFPSARPPIGVLLSLIPRIKARHYSIASSARLHPMSVHLLVVEVSWTTPKGAMKYGQCSHFMADARVGDRMRVSVLPSEMRMPSDVLKPIVMAGLGTGMAPFRAFIQERAALKAAGTAVGPVVLYMGSRNRAMEYLYGDELDAYVADGLLTRLRLAFSRDGPHKVYIQHLMSADGAMLHNMLHASGQGGSFYLCGPTWPEPDVEEAITSAFAAPLMSASTSLTREDAVVASKAEIRAMKEAKRYVLEVY